MDNQVRLVQLLCGPKRHAITAIAYFPGISASTSQGDDVVLSQDNAVAYLKEIVDGWLTRKMLNPWCGLCGARAEVWLYEDAATKFGSMDEALPHLKETERQNLEARQLLGDINDRKN